MHKFITSHDSDECTASEWKENLADDENWVGFDDGSIYLLTHSSGNGYHFRAVSPDFNSAKYSGYQRKDCIEQAMVYHEVYCFESLEELARHLA
jgi:hypothetical protein